MFKSSLLKEAYVDTAALLRAIADNVVYGYGVVDTIGGVAIAAFNTKKTTESQSTTTTRTSAPRMMPVADMDMEAGFVCMVTGTAGGEPALAYLSDDWTGFNANVVENLDRLATAMGYDDWFIAPQLHPNNQYFGDGKCLMHQYKLGLSGGQSPYAATFTQIAPTFNMPMFVLDVPEQHPKTYPEATWFTPGSDAYLNGLIEFMRNNEFSVAVRGARADGVQRFLLINQRQYITDLENTQDVLRQVSLAGESKATAAESGIQEEAATRLAADRALRDTVDSFTVFGNTFKQIVNRNDAMNQYIPRP